MTSFLSYDQVVSWDTELTAPATRIAGPLFTRPESRQAFTDPVRALPADVPRKNSWQLADHIGHTTAHRFERLLDRAKWDTASTAAGPGCPSMWPSAPSLSW